MLHRPIHSFRQYLLNRMVLRPSRYPIEPSTQQRVMLTANERPLECFVQQNFDSDDPPELLILKFPGTAGRAELATTFPAAMLGDVRVEMWTWNPPGYGRSSGRASLARIADAAIEFWTQVTQRRRGATTSVWLCANSLGCVSALHVAASLQPDPRTSGMIMRNPPPLVPVVKRVAERYPLGGWIHPVVESLCDSMNAMHTAGQVTLPAVFLQSELDTLVPIAYQNQVIDAYAGQHRVVLMEGLDHGGIATEQHEPRIEDSIGWLWERTGCTTDEPSSDW